MGTVSFRYIQRIYLFLFFFLNKMQEDLSHNHLGNSHSIGTGLISMSCKLLYLCFVFSVSKKNQFETSSFYDGNYSLKLANSTKICEDFRSSSSVVENRCVFKERENGFVYAFTICICFNQF